MLFDLAHVAPMAAFVFVWIMIGWMLVGDRLTDIRRRRPEAAEQASQAPQPHYSRRRRNQKAAV